MAQEVLFQDFFLEEALVVNKGGKTARDVFINSLKSKKISDANLVRFNPLINGKSANWDDILLEGDQLQVLPQIAGG